MVVWMGDEPDVRAWVNADQAAGEFRVRYAELFDTEARLHEQRLWPRFRAAARPGHGRCTAGPGRAWSRSPSPPGLNSTTHSRNELLVFQFPCRFWGSHREGRRRRLTTPGSPEGSGHGPHRPDHHRRCAHGAPGARGAGGPVEAAGARCQPSQPSQPSQPDDHMPPAGARLTRLRGPASCGVAPRKYLRDSVRSR